jgi:hypothetical protein
MSECPVCERVHVMLRECLTLLESHEPEPDAPVSAGCAACERGDMPTADTLHLHTGNGKHCRQSETPVDVAEVETKLDKLREKKGRAGPGRPRKNAVSPERAAELRAQANAAQAETMKNHKPPVVDDARRETKEPPRWCRCGHPATWTGKNWTCPKGHENVLENLLHVQRGVPGERIDLLVEAVNKLGLKFTSLDVAQWPVTKRDVVRAMIEQRGDVKGFLEEIDPEHIIPKPAPAPEQELDPFGF